MVIREMRIAFLGLGIMGSRMAANLAGAGFELIVWNRTSSTAERFAAEHGAQLAATPFEAAQSSEVVLTMVVDGPQVQSLLLDPHIGAAAGAWPGTLFVDCSTIGPSASHAINARLAGYERELRLIDAPVTGSSPAAQAGTLTFMVGASAQDFERVRPLLEAMGTVIVHAGPPGHGQMVKLINNAVAAINAAALGQALLVGARAGVNLDALVAVMRAGSGASTMLELKATPMRTHDYATLFKLDHMLKDVNLCLQEAHAVGSTFSFAELTAEILATGAELGYGNADFASLIEALEAAAGTRL
jgi:3-hydroxyisobutyrate dehydrogenase-like beta-hydroxyacid dehydrogenase